MHCGLYLYVNNERIRDFKLRFKKNDQTGTNQSPALVAMITAVMVIPCYTARYYNPSFPVLIQYSNQFYLNADPSLLMINYSVIFIP